MDTAVYSESPSLHFEPTPEGGRLYLRGPWRSRLLPQIVNEIRAHLPDLSGKVVIFDARELKELDTGGALAIFKYLVPLARSVKFENFPPETEAVLQLVRDRGATSPVPHSQPRSLLRRIGEATEEFFRIVRDIFSFIGETIVAFAKVVRHPTRFRLRECVVQLEQVGIDAIPIVALTTFLVGVVIAYLFAIQIEKYGANIFIVDAVGLAVFRELSPIIVAIVLAGRSGSAFTAHIGTMKLNEEIDAMVALGLSPMHVLVLPRFVALIIALPLLVFVGDVVGLAGSMMIAHSHLDITTATFLDRLQAVLPIRHFFIGLIKAPVFAAFIAVIGCRMGLNVENNARSVGLSTTSTVVQSIVSVIVLNSVFAVIFQQLKL